MKNKSTLLLTCLLSATLISCGGVGRQSSPEATSLEESSAVELPSSEAFPSKEEESTEPSTPEESEEIEESIVVINDSEVTEVTDGSCTGQLVDINMNFFVASESRYDCRFVSKNLNDPSITFKSSRPESVTVEPVEGNFTDFVLVTHAAGDSILSIYDSEEMLVYRHIVRVRKAYSPEEIGQALYDFDTYVGIYDNHQVAFLDYGPVYGLFTGSDEVERNIRIEFNATFTHVDEAFDMYYFTIETLEANEGSQTSLTHFIVSPCADQIVFYYDAGGGQEAMLNAFYPKSLAALHDYSFHG